MPQFQQRICTCHWDPEWREGRGEEDVRGGRASSMSSPSRTSVLSSRHPLRSYLHRSRVRPETSHVEPPPPCPNPNPNPRYMAAHFTGVWGFPCSSKTSCRQGKGHEAPIPVQGQPWVWVDSCPSPRNFCRRLRVESAHRTSHPRACCNPLQAPTRAPADERGRLRTVGTPTNVFHITRGHLSHPMPVSAPLGSGPPSVGPVRGFSDPLHSPGTGAALRGLLDVGGEEWAGAGRRTSLIMYWLSWDQTMRSPPLPPEGLSSGTHDTPSGSGERAGRKERAAHWRSRSGTSPASH
jgi:hypothetical protein